MKSSGSFWEKIIHTPIYCQCCLFLSVSASQHYCCLHYEFHQYCFDILLISRIIIDWSASLITREKWAWGKRGNMKQLKYWFFHCFLQCRVLLQNHFLSSANNTDGYLFFEWVCSTQADGCELLGDVKWILYWVCLQHFWFNMHWCSFCARECVGLTVMHRALRTHWAEGGYQVQDVGSMHPLPHTFSVTMPPQTLPAPPNRTGRPLSACVWMKSK